jgi:transcriptional regulator with XRE-family HTH domain
MTPSPKIDPALVTVLCGLRAQVGISQEALAFEAGLTIATLSRIERGVTNPAWSSIRDITRALEIRLDELGAAIHAYEREMAGA